MTVDRIRDLCLSFPEATEDIKWDGHLVFPPDWWSVRADVLFSRRVSMAQTRRPRHRVRIGGS
jgi:hypothetical protein